MASSPSKRQTQPALAGSPVKVKLAHPLQPDNPFTGSEAEVGDEIEVSESQARTLGAAGYVQPDGAPDAVLAAIADVSHQPQTQ